MRGRGYAKEAALCILQYGVTELGLTNIGAGAFTENTASVIQILGFKHIARDEFFGRTTIRYYQSSVA